MERQWLEDHHFRWMWNYLTLENIRLVKCGICDEEFQITYKNYDDNTKMNMKCHITREHNFHLTKNEQYRYMHNFNVTPCLQKEKCKHCDRYEITPNIIATEEMTSHIKTHNANEDTNYRLRNHLTTETSQYYDLDMHNNTQNCKMCSASRKSNLIILLKHLKYMHNHTLPVNIRGLRYDIADVDYDANEDFSDLNI